MVEEAVSASAPTIWAVINSWFTPTVFFVVLQFVIATIYITSNITANTGATNQKQQHQQNPQGDGTHQQQQQQLPRSPLQMLKSINFHSYYTYRSQQPPLEVQNAPHSRTHEAAEQQEEHPPQSQIPRSPTTQPLNPHNYYRLPTTETDTSMFQTTHESEKHHLDNDEITETHEQQEKHHFHLDDTTTTTTMEAEEPDEEDHKGEEAGLGPSLDEVYRQLVQGGQGRHFKRSQSDTTPGSGQEPVKMKKSALSHHLKEDEMVAVENRRPARDEEGVDAKADDFINRFKQQLKLQRFDSVVS